MRNIAVLLSLGFASFASAQEHCAAGETARQCATKIVHESPQQVAQAAAPAQPVGIFDSTSPARSTLKDFLSILNTHLDLSSLKDESDTLTFAYNLPGSLLGASRQVQLETKFYTPKLMPLVRGTFATTEAADALERKLSNADDYSAALSFAPATRLLGKDRIEPHQTLVDSLVIEGLLNGLTGGVDADAPLTDPAGFENTVRAALPAAIEKVKADLGPRLANQSRLYVTAGTHHRRDVVGPDDRSAQVTLELGSQNLTSFYANEGRDCAPSCAAAFARFVQRTKNVALAGRFAFDIKWMSSSHVLLPIYKTDVKGTHLVTYSVGYGRPFASLLNGKEGKLDLRITFDGKHTKTDLAQTAASRAIVLAELLPEVEPERDHRVAAVTYTQQMSDRVSIPVSVIHTDRVFTLPASGPIVSPFPTNGAPVTFRDHRLSVHLGVMYRVPPATAPSPSPKCCCCS